MKTNTKKILSLCIVGSVLLLSALPNFAIAETITFKNPFSSGSITGLLNTIISDILMPIGGVVAVLMVMYAGFQYVTAQGNETKIKKATEALQYAVIGAAILLGAWVISNAIQGTINQLKA